MSIYGLQRTTLGVPGGPSNSRGKAILTLMLELKFTRQVAGSLNAEFCEPNAIFPVQFAQGSDMGLRIVITVVDDTGAQISLFPASAKTIRLKKPDLTTTDTPAALVTNGMDGRMYIVLQPSALTQYGYYFVQGLFTIAGESKSTRLGQFQVKDNIPCPLP